MAATTFGDRVRALRMEKRISLRALARRLGWSSAYVSDIELNQRNPPSRDRIRQIADFLGGNVEELLGLAEQQRRSVELSIDRERPHRMRFGLTLARCWDGLEEDEIRQLEELLNSMRSRYGSK